MKKLVMCTFLTILMLVQSSNLIYGADISGNSISISSSSVNTIYKNYTLASSSKVSTPKIVSITHDKGYIFGIKGTISAKQIKFTAKMENYTMKVIDGDQGQWYFSNPAVAKYSKGQITILGKGTTTATFVIDGVSTSLMLFAKESEKDKYVLYEENFDGLQNNTFPQGWVIKDGANLTNTYVNGGAFYIDARFGTVRVLLPEFLNKFGNYMIEADVTNVSANDATSWNGIVYRIQNNNYPYFQMTVKKRATAVNGIEFAEKNISNVWIVGKTNFYTEDISENKVYRYTVKTYENIAQHWIGNVLLMSVNTWGMYPVGGIGFQANGCIMKIDNVKVSLLEEPLELVNSSDNFVRVKEADTKIALAPTIIAEAKSKKEFENIVSGGQAGTIILNVNKNLEVTGYGINDVIGNVAEFYGAMKSKFIPAFRVFDSEAALAISNYLKENGIEDAFVVSKYPALVKQARDNYTFIRGVIEFENLTYSLDTYQLLNMISFANSNRSRIILLPAEAATKSNIQYLQQRLITVWTRDTSKADESEKTVLLHRIITSGTNGILTDSVGKAVEALSLYNRNTTIIRRPFLIGHRGVPDLAPENTIEGSELAFKLGADMVENDIWLTKAGADGKQHVVVIHDETLERTTNGKGKITELTLEQLSTVFANKQFVNKYPTAKIPTLAQYFEKFKDREQALFVEIKGGDPRTVDGFVELTRRLKAQGQAITISSSPDQLRRTKALMPEISLGNVRSGYDFKTDIYESLRFVLWENQSLDSCLMPNCESISKEFMEIAKHRGITVWPWNVNNKTLAIHYFKMGTWGISTDCAYVFSDWAVEITPKQGNVFLRVGGMTALEANIKTYNGTVRSVTPEVVVLSGNDCIEATGNIVKAKKTGTAYVTLRYMARLSELPEDVYDIYTSPLRIKVE